MIHYLKMLDSVNARILEGLSRYGPRNTSFLARSVGLPATTVAFRIKKLIEKGNLHVRTNLEHSKLGLMRAVLVAETTGGLEERLRRVIENIGYWTYMARCYGKFNGTYALFAFPVEHKDKLEAYLKRAVRYKAMSDYVFSWVTDLCEVPRNFDWFDFESKAWKFPWSRWVDEVLEASQKLASRLVEPEKYRVTVDETDLFLLKELERDAFAEFSRIAGALQMSPQGVRYRYYKHVLKRSLIADYEIAILPYPLMVSDMCSFIVHFPNEEAMAKFSNTLSNKPLILNFGKTIGQNSLLIHTYTPKTETPNFIKALNTLVRRNLVTDFSYVNLDIPSFKRQTISYELFRDKSWTFNIRDKSRRLSEIMRIEKSRSV